MMCQKRERAWARLTSHERLSRRPIDVSCASASDGGCGAMPGWPCHCAASVTDGLDLSPRMLAMMTELESAVGGRMKYQDTTTNTRGTARALQARGLARWSVTGSKPGRPDIVVVKTPRADG